jgi:hypothetical protein
MRAWALPQSSACTGHSPWTKAFPVRWIQRLAASWAGVGPLRSRWKPRPGRQAQARPSIAAAFARRAERIDQGVAA